MEPGLQLVQRLPLSGLGQSLYELERTIIDGLKQSEYRGGFTEVAKGFWMRRDDIDHGKLADYALRLDVGALIRRLGFLLETFDVAPAQRGSRPDIE